MYPMALYHYLLAVCTKCSGSILIQIPIKKLVKEDSVTVATSATSSSSHAARCRDMVHYSCMCGSRLILLHCMLHLVSVVFMPSLATYWPFLYKISIALYYLQHPVRSLFLFFLYHPYILIFVENFYCVLVSALFMERKLTDIIAH